MKHEAMTAESFGTGRISSILIRLTPPVMIAQFIQAMYNTSQQSSQEPRASESHLCCMVRNGTSRASTTTDSLPYSSNSFGSFTSQP